jgi:hypothetical protein
VSGDGTLGATSRLMKRMRILKVELRETMEPLTMAMMLML